MRGRQMETNNQRAVNDCSIGTWSRYIQRSSIEKWGTQAGKALYPAMTARNKTQTLRIFIMERPSLAKNCT